MTKKFVTGFKIVWITLIWGCYIAAVILGPKTNLILMTLTAILATIQTLSVY